MTRYATRIRVIIRWEHFATSCKSLISNKLLLTGITSLTRMRCGLTIEKINGTAKLYLLMFRKPWNQHGQVAGRGPVIQLIANDLVPARCASPRGTRQAKNVGGIRYAGQGA